MALVPTDNVKAYYLIVEQTNNGAAAETVEIELTIDGTIDIDIGAGVLSGTPYYLYYNIDGDIWWNAAAIQLVSRDLDQSVPLQTRSLGIRVRQTSVVDLVAAQIEVNMVYATQEVT